MMDRSDVPEHLLRLYDRAMSGKSRQAAIRAHCIMCMGWTQSEVPLCTAKGCPLYPYRLTSYRKASANAQETGAESTRGDETASG